MREGQRLMDFGEETMRDITPAITGELKQTGWQLPSTMTYDEWSGAGQVLNKIDNARQWWIGDWWNAGVEWGKGREACEANDLIYQTCQNCGSVSESFQISRRRENLTFKHHAEVLALKHDNQEQREQLQDKFLDWCLFNNDGNERPKRKSTRDLREAINKYLSDQDWTEDQKVRKAQLEAGQSVLVNMSKDKETGKPADDKLIQWAQFNNHLVRIDRGGIWGNPFELPADGDRDTVCDNYATYLAMKPSLQKRLPELKGKALACWCYPERCHGHALMESS